MQPRIEVSENQVVSDQPTSPVTSTMLSDCVQACVECQLACTACTDASLADDHVADMRRCIRVGLDCAEICGLTSRMLIRFVNSDVALLRAQLATCARACVTCEAECRARTSIHGDACAAACARCYETCRNLLRQLAATN